MLSLTVPGSWVIPTPFGYLLGSGLQVPTLPPLDLQHIPKQSAIPLLRCWRDSGGRISSGSRPGESLSTKGRWRERARGLERGPRGSQVCQDMSRQPAAELRSYGRQLRRISLLLFPTPPSRSGWERGGDVRAPPRPRLPGADRVLRLQSASQPAAAKDAQAAASFPAAVISLATATPLLPAESPGWLRRALASSHSPPDQPARAPRCARLPGFPTGSRSVSHASDCR